MDQQLDHAILQTIQSSRQPIGSWSIFYFLRERGFDVSAPTIGRRLRDLERLKLLKKSTVDGRVITSQGERLLRKVARDGQNRARANKLLKALDGKTQKDVIDQLIVRRIIEAESAGLAAAHASKSLVAKLEALVQKQKDSIQKRRNGCKRRRWFS